MVYWLSVGRFIPTYWILDISVHQLDYPVLRQKLFPISFNSGFQPNQKTDNKGFIRNLYGGSWTEEMCWFKSHNMSTSSCLKKWWIPHSSRTILLHWQTFVKMMWITFFGVLEVSKSKERTSPFLTLHLLFYSFDKPLSK